jgi:hypothetical protein
MKKYLFVVSRYSGEKETFFNSYISKRNKRYCDIHGFEYIEIGNDFQIELFRDNPTWWKFSIVRDFIRKGLFKYGDIVTHIDADICLAKIELPLITSKSFTYSIDSGNTHCMGVYSIRINEWTVKLFDLILDDKRFESLNNRLSIHEPSCCQSSFWKDFREQASWYSLAGIKRHSWIPFWNLPNYGWLSSVDEWTVFSIKDLYENVEILPTTWNVTELIGESECRFNINNTPKEDVIIRHFAGGQLWRKEWFDI